VECLRCLLNLLMFRRFRRRRRQIRRQPAGGGGGGRRLSGERTVKNPPVGFPGLVGRGGLDTTRQLYGQIFMFIN